MVGVQLEGVRYLSAASFAPCGGALGTVWGETGAPAAAPNDMQPGQTATIRSTINNRVKLQQLGQLFTTTKTVQEHPPSSPLKNLYKTYH